jgi:four helix bundle protein
MGKRASSKGESDIMEKEAKGFRTLNAWKKSYELTRQVYRLSKKFPKEETYALTSQLQRAAVSVPANIAEGYERNHRKEYLQYLYIAKGSLGEVETYLLLSKDLGYLPEKEYEAINQIREETGRIIKGLIKALEGNKDSSK